MTATDRIAKLEAILARVTARAGAPRGVRVEVVPPLAVVGHDAVSTEAMRPDVAPYEDGALAAAPSTVAPTSVEVDMEADVPTRQVTVPPASLDVSSDQEAQSSERVIAAQALDEPVSEPAGEPYLPTFTPSENLPVAEAESAVRSESAFEPELRPEPEPEPHREPEPQPEPESHREPEPHPEPEPQPVAARDVEPSEPPASSRRPIALEPKLEDLAFGDVAPESPHTPPPESGRQVSSLPVDLDFDGDFTGIRSREQGDAEVAADGHPPASVPGSAPAAIEYREPEPLEPEFAKPLEALSPEVAPVEPAPVEPAPAEPTDAPAEPPPAVAVLLPELTLPDLPDSSSVAVFAGGAPAFKPASFGELLEATLSL